MAAHYRLLVIGALFSLPYLSIQQRCSTTSDLGTAECVLLTPVYTQYQWATCLTEDYIMRASNNAHVCASDQVTQCYYQCMLEIYGAEGGSVSGDCTCSPGEELPTPTIIRPECYSPSGDDCSWYRNCLEARYRCGSDGYAIRFAEKFCNLYSDNFNDFSEDARLWINAVRKCLQVFLVPNLRLWTMDRTCADIRREAFGSHTNCYLNPSPGVPGICQLSCIDALKITWLVNVEGGAIIQAPRETFTQMVGVVVECFGLEAIQRCTEDIATTLVISIYDTLSTLYDDAVSITGQAIDYVAEQLGWESNGFSWFLFDSDDNDDEIDNRRRRQISPVDNLSIRIMLVDIKGLNISNGTMTQPLSGQSLEQAVEAFSQAVSSGMLSRIPIVLNGTESVTGVLSAGQCNDTICNSTDVMELASAPHTAPPSTTGGTPSPTRPSSTPSSPTRPSGTPSSTTRPSGTPSSPIRPSGGAAYLHLHRMAILGIIMAIYTLT